MKCKVLLTGKNTSIIDDFFRQMDDDFEALTTTGRFSDIMGHVKYYKPDALVYCIANETRDSITQLMNVKDRLSDAGIPIVLIGNADECDEFEKIAINVSDLTLHKPLAASTIQSRLLRFLENWKPPVRDAHAGFLFSEQPSPANESIVSGALFSPGDSFSPPPAAPKPAPQNKHILVVDDAPMMLKTIKEHLHNEYDVATAVSGSIAMKFLERKKTDLILLDYEMPGENGPMVLEKLRANPATKNIPVVFLTGVSEREKIQEALALKPQGYLLKPIDRDKLLEVIKKVIG